MGIRRFSDNFPKIYAKTRFSKIHELASQASSTQTKQTKYSLHERSEHRERARQAQSSQIKQTKNSPYEWSELRKRASQVQSLQTSLRKANQANHNTNVNKAKLSKLVKQFGKATKQASKQVSKVKRKASK